MLASMLVRGGFGFVYGSLMLVGAFASAGFGHGTYLPVAVIGAPLSLIPGAEFFMAPVWWGTLAGLTVLRNRIPLLVLLAVHLATVVCFFNFGTPFEPGDDMWRSFRDTMPELARWIRGTLTAYGIALVAVVAVACTPVTAQSPDPDDCWLGR
jgi:hypothetical protein